MTREEARRYWTAKYEAARKWDDPYWEASERKEHRRYVDALNTAIEALSAEAVQGVWINREYCQVDEDAYEVATCSNCKSEITIEYPHDNYCPNCGADMRGENYD